VSVTLICCFCCSLGSVQSRLRGIPRVTYPNSQLFFFSPLQFCRVIGSTTPQDPWRSHSSGWCCVLSELNRPFRRSLPTFKRRSVCFGTENSVRRVHIQIGRGKDVKAFVDPPHFKEHGNALQPYLIPSTRLQCIHLRNHFHLMRRFSFSLNVRSSQQQLFGTHRNQNNKRGSKNWFFQQRVSHFSLH